MPALKYKEYYSEQMQFIDRYIAGENNPTDETRLKRIDKLQDLQTIYFLDEFLDIPEKQAMETTRIGFRPIKAKHYANEKDFLAPSAEAVQMSKNRSLTRYRLIYGPVTFYLNRQFDDPTEIPLITACAPNLMGTSPTDLAQFSEGGKKNDKGEWKNRCLKEKEYKAECKKIADFIVKRASAAGNQRLIMPAFGVGVYINTLDENSQKQAKRIMYDAFANAAKASKIEIHWVIQKPDDIYPSNQGSMQTVVQNDMLSYAAECMKKGEKIVLLNPGSDRTIGGNYPHENPKTLEEQIAQQSDLIFLHSQFNDWMEDRFMNDFASRKRALSPPSPSPDITSTDGPAQFDKKDPDTREALKATAQAIAHVLRMDESPFIIQGKDYKVSFKTKAAAITFRDYLASNGVTGSTGQPKAVCKDSLYHVVFLTPEQWLKFSKILGSVPGQTPDPTPDPVSGPTPSLVSDPIPIPIPPADPTPTASKQEKVNQTLHKIDAIINKLESKIVKIDQHYCLEAHSKAVILLGELRGARQTYASEALGPRGMGASGETFQKTCTEAVERARPILERDLSWGRYLQNMLKKLANALIWVGSLGQVNTFFALKKSDSITALEEAEKGLIPPKNQ